MPSYTLQERNAIVDSHDDVDVVSWTELGWSILFTDGANCFPGEDITSLELAIVLARG